VGIKTLFATYPGTKAVFINETAHAAGIQPRFVSIGNITSGSPMMLAMTTVAQEASSSVIIQFIFAVPAKELGFSSKSANKTAPQVLGSLSTAISSGTFLKQLQVTLATNSPQAGSMISSLAVDTQATTSYIQAATSSATITVVNVAAPAGPSLQPISPQTHFPSGAPKASLTPTSNHELTHPPGAVVNSNSATADSSNVVGIAVGVSVGACICLCICVASIMYYRKKKQNEGLANDMVKISIIS